MSDAQTATSSADAAANQAALEELVSGLGIADDEPNAPAAPAAPASPAPKPAAAGAPAKPADADADLSDLDDPSKPFTAERAAEVRQRLTAARERAREETRKANAASARARAQEERFTRTKEKVLEQKSSVDAERALIDGVRRALFSGNKDTVLQAIGHISGKDPLEAWQEISLGVAGKRKAVAERDPELLSVIQNLQEEIAMLKGGHTASQALAEAAQVEQLRDQLVAAAGESTAHTLVSTFAKNEETRPQVRALLAEIKEGEFKKRGRPIDNQTAFGILESRLKAQSELFQQVHAPNGQATDERGTTGLAPGDSAVSRQEPAKQAPSPPPRTIPAELSGRSGGMRRPLTEAERINEIARQTPASFFRDIGLGGLLLDGED